MSHRMLSLRYPRQKGIVCIGVCVEDGVIILDPLRLEGQWLQRQHWTVQARAAKAVRTNTFFWLTRLLARDMACLPLQITITRVAPRIMDAHDNLCRACKGVTDGVADWIAGEHGQGEDTQEGLVWFYTQRKGKPRQYAVEIRIHRMRAEKG